MNENLPDQRENRLLAAPTTTEFCISRLSEKNRGIYTVSKRKSDVRQESTNFSKEDYVHSREDPCISGQWGGEPVSPDSTWVGQAVGRSILRDHGGRRETVTDIEYRIPMQYPKCIKLLDGFSNDRLRWCN